MYRDADSFPVVSLFSNTSIVSLRHVIDTRSKGCLRCKRCLVEKCSICLKYSEQLKNKQKLANSTGAFKCAIKALIGKAVKKSNEALVYGLKVRFSFSKLGRLFFYRPSKAPLESLQYFSI